MRTDLPSKTLGVRLSKDAYEILEKYAKEDEREISQLVRHILKIWLLEKKKIDIETANNLFPIRTRRAK